MELLALAVLTLLKASEAVDDVLSGLLEANHLDADFFLELAPYALGSFGEVGFQKVLAEIERLEQEPEKLLDLPHQDENFYRHFYYWTLIQGLQIAASEYPQLKDPYLEQTKKRIQDENLSVEFVRLWVAEWKDGQDKRLDTEIEAFFTRHSDFFPDDIIGDFQDWLTFRELYGQSTTPRERAMRDIKNARDYITEARKPKPLKQSRSEALPFAPSFTPQPTPIKIGRNEPCPCDSGKKFKHCHGNKGQKYFQP